MENPPNEQERDNEELTRLSERLTAAKAIGDAIGQELVMAEIDGIFDQQFIDQRVNGEAA